LPFLLSHVRLPTPELEPNSWHLTQINFSSTEFSQLLTTTDSSQLNPSL
jgi:hypothetical protein